MHKSKLQDRLNSVKNTTDEKKLKKFALNDPSDSVREIAVSKITDTNILSHIVKNEKSIKISKKAIDNIGDEYELKNLFIELSKRGIKYSEEINSEIINRITVPSYLIEMIEVNFSKQILAKILEIKPEYKLSSKIRKNIPKSNYDRILMESGYYSQKKITEIALTSSRWTLRRDATKLIKNQDTLIKIALTDSDSIVRAKATQQIKNQKILEKIAFTESNMNVRHEAVKQIKNQKTLEKIAFFDSIDIIRCEAIKLIKNQDTLIKIALTDSDWQCRLEATKLIKNQNALIEIALTDSNDDVSKEAIQQLDKDQSSILEIALSNELVVERLDEETAILYEALKREGF